MAAAREVSAGAAAAVVHMERRRGKAEHTVPRGTQAQQQKALDGVAWLKLPTGSLRLGVTSQNDAFKRGSSNHLPIFFLPLPQTHSTGTMF